MNNFTERQSTVDFSSQLTTRLSIFIMNPRLGSAVPTH